MECLGCVCWNERGVELVGVDADIDVVADAADALSEFQHGYGYHCCDSCL
jgi:hypothetical protein